MPKKILIVDDDINISNSLALLMREEGYLVDNTSDSAEGAILLQKNTYDVGIFDYKMKGLQGSDLLKMMKNKDPRCAVFIMSGMLNINTLKADKSLSSLAAGIISKPFDIEELFQKIRIL